MDYQNYDCTRTTFVPQNVVLSIEDLVHEGVFSLFKPIYYRLLGVLRKARLHSDEVVEVVSQIISAVVSSVTIINREERAAWPMVGVDVQSLFGRKQVCNYGDSIFVVVANKTLVGIGCISSHHPCALVGHLGRVIVRNNYFKCRLNLESLLLLATFALLFTTGALNFLRGFFLGCLEHF